MLFSFYVCISFVKEREQIALVRQISPRCTTPAHNVESVMSSGITDPSVNSESVIEWPAFTAQGLASNYISGWMQWSNHSSIYRLYYVLNGSQVMITTPVWDICLVEFYCPLIYILQCIRSNVVLHYFLLHTTFKKPLWLAASLLGYCF